MTGLGYHAGSHPPGSSAGRAAVSTTVGQTTGYLATYSEAWQLRRVFGTLGPERSALADKSTVGRRLRWSQKSSGCRSPRLTAPWRRLTAPVRSQCGGHDSSAEAATRRLCGCSEIATFVTRCDLGPRLACNPLICAAPRSQLRSTSAGPNDRLCA